MIITSFKTDVEISTLKGSPWIIHQSPTLYHYVNLLTNTRFPKFFLNTVIVTVCSVVLSMCISVIAAYSLARMRFFGSGALAAGVFLTYLVPDTLLFIPLLKVLGFLGLLNTKWALVAVYPCLAVPFCTWIMIGYFASIPKELDEAALIDGAGNSRCCSRSSSPSRSRGSCGHHLRLHGLLGRLLIPGRVHLQPGGNGGDRGHRCHAHPRRRVPLGRADGRRAHGGCTARPDLRVPDGLLHRGPYGRGDEGIAVTGRA